MSNFELLPIHKEYFYFEEVEVEGAPSIAATLDSPSVLHLRKPIDPNIKLIFGDVWGLPSKIVMPDYLTSPKSIFSQKVYDALAPLNIPTIQLLKSSIYIDDTWYNDYWTLHNYTRILCIDYEQTNGKLVFPVIDGEKIVVDAKVLSKIPLKERLIFRFKDADSIEVIHESVVQEIMSVKPTGIKFISLLDYSF